MKGWIIFMKPNISYSKLIWNALPLIGLGIWGALSVTNGLWYDEAYSAALVSKSIPELIDITSKDVHSPFYYILAKGFYHLCGGNTNYWSLKVFSLLFSFAYLLLGKYGIRRLYDVHTSIYFMLFSILMPIMTVQTTNARMYSCGLFFFTATGMLLIELYQQETSFMKWFLLTTCSICSVYCHTFQMIETLLIYTFFFASVICSKQYWKLKGFFISGMIVAVSYLPWLRITFLQMQSRIDQTSYSIADSSMSDARFQTLITYCKEWFSAGETPYALVMYLGMTLCIVLGYYAVDYMRQHKNYIAGFGFFVILLTTLLGTWLNLYVASCFMGRYVFPSFSALALIYALGMKQIQKNVFKICIAAVSLYCFLVQYHSELTLDYQTELNQYQEFILENIDENDVIMTEAYYLLMLSVYYPDLTYMAYGHLDEWMPFHVDSVFTEWEQLEEISGTLWYIGKDPGLLSEQYTYEKALSFHHMYYDIEVYKMIPLSRSTT